MPNDIRSLTASCNAQYIWGELYNHCFKCPFRTENGASLRSRQVDAVREKLTRCWTNRLNAKSGEEEESISAMPAAVCLELFNPSRPLCSRSRGLHEKKYLFRFSWRKFVG